MRKLWIMPVLMLQFFCASAATVDLSGGEQPGVKLTFTGNTGYHDDRKNSPFRLMNDGSAMQLTGEAFENATGFDLAVRPKGHFEIRGKLNGTAFIMRYADGYLLCRSENSQTTGLVPAYAWNNHETRCLFVRRGSDGAFSFFADGVPALEQTGINIEKPEAEYPLTLKAFGPVEVQYVASASTPLTPERAGELFGAMVNRKPRQSLPLLVIPEFRPPEGDAAFDEKNWRDAARITGFVLMDSGKLCERQTVVLLGADSEGIYVYFKSPVVEKLNGSPMSHDEGFGGDSVEFFFMPAYTETFDYYQFIGNFLGSTYDSRGLDRLWNGKWTHQARHDDKEWVSVFRIRDFSTFAAPPPAAGARWRFNVCRDWPSAKGWLWSEFANTPGSFLNYNSFAHAVYGGAEFPFFRIDGIAETENHTLSARFEAVNPAGRPVTLKAVYEFFAPGSFNVTRMSEEVISLPGNSRKHISLSVAAPETAGGMAELSIVNTATGELLYKQAVIL